MTRTKKVSTAVGLQRKVLPMTKKALAALEEAALEMDEVVTWICSEAVALGMNNSQVNWVNAQSYVHSKVEYLLSAEEKVKELGYASLPTALKALSQVRQKVTSDLDLVHEELRTVPNIWLTGKPKGRKISGFLGLTLSVALRRHRCMMPLIVEVWQLTDGDEETREQLLWNYKRMSADDFEKELYRYIHELEVVPLEEELDEVVHESVDDLVSTYNHMFDSNRIYGVTSDPMPSVNWDEE